MKLKLNEVKWVVPGHPSRWQNSGNLTPGAKALSSALPPITYMSLGKSCLSPWASVSLSKNERPVLEIQGRFRVLSAKLRGERGRD